MVTVMGGGWRVEGGVWMFWLEAGVRGGKRGWEVGLKILLVVLLVFSGLELMKA